MTLQPVLLADRYQLGDIIGVGGMGTVYLAVDTHTNGEVAIKKLKLDAIAADASIEERFKREADALRKLNHPNIVKVLATFLHGDESYLVMEYVAGGTVAHLIREHHPVPLHQILEIGLGLADALTRAHHLKIIHRDIKPVNILLDQDKTPRLTDFGVALLNMQERVTTTGVTIGTLDYLSPEVINGEPADARSDIWALGLVLWELIFGNHPFKAESPTQTLIAIVQRPLPEMTLTREDIPPALITLVSQMLHKERDKRIASARIVGAELEALVNGSTTPLKGRWQSDAEKSVTDVATVKYPWLEEMSPVTPTPVPFGNGDDSPTPAPIPYEVPATPAYTTLSDTHDVRKMNPSGTSRTRLSFGIGFGALLAIIVGGLVAVSGSNRSVSEAITTPPPVLVTPTTQIIDSEDLPAGWKVIQSDSFTMALPSSWSDLTTSPIVANFVQQIFADNTQLELENAAFTDFVGFLLSPDVTQLVAADLSRLSYLLIAKEQTGLPASRDLLIQRLENLTGSMRDRYEASTNIILDGYPGIRQVARGIPIANVNTVTYAIINNNTIYWIIIGISNPTINFEKEIAILEKIVSTIQFTNEE